MEKISSVLLIDDDETTNYINRLIINRTGIAHELLTAVNGKDALDLIRERCEGHAKRADSCVPNLILLDINMPILDGFGFLDAFSLLEEVKAHNVVIAVLTTSLNPTDMERVKAAGITDLLNKPLTQDTLMQLVKKHFPTIAAAAKTN